MMVSELPPYDQRSRAPAFPPASVLMLYDDRSTHVATLLEHLRAFRRHSRHRVFFMPATSFVKGVDDLVAPPDLAAFDAVVVHYSVRLSLKSHLSAGLAAAVAAFGGPKILFIQDEYDETETARQWIARLGASVVYTNVPAENVEAVYPRARFPAVDFVQTLTGYVPEDAAYDEFAMPLAERPLVIGYRGRRLPHHYGDLGYEKYRIGVDMRRFAEERGVAVDIEVEGPHRIYGTDWYRFLGACRATLGTESGSNVFDTDGSLARLASRHEAMPYEEFRARFLQGREGQVDGGSVRMNQISPKIFEAIGLRTALVLFEGDYSGVVEPHRHFISLRKDYANVDEVFRLLADDAYVTAMTERAYADVLASGRFSYARFIADFDAHLDRLLSGRERTGTPPTGTLALPDGTAATYAALHPGLRLASDLILTPSFTREQMLDALPHDSCAQAPPLTLTGVRSRLAGTMQAAASQARAGNSGAASGLIRRAWHCLPERWRSRIVAFLN